MTASIWSVPAPGWIFVTELSKYRTIIFDCDGVVLDSNWVKTEAFRAAASPWGDSAADALVAHHVANGGVSRYEKFTHFINRILPELARNSVPGRDGPDLEVMLADYARAARAGLLSCQVAIGLPELRAATTQARWMIVSGGDQRELRDVFDQRGLARLFDGGIFGSPDSKFRILEREIERATVEFPMLLLGDSRLDHQAASEHGIDFLFVSEWTEFSGWEAYLALHGLKAIPTVSTLLQDQDAEL